MVCHHRRGREGTNQVYGTAEVTHTQELDLPVDAEVLVDQLIIQLHRQGHHRPLALVQKHSPQVIQQALAELEHQPPAMANHGGWLEWRCRSLTRAALMATVTPQPEPVDVARTDAAPRATWETAGDLVRRKEARQ